MEVSGEVGNVLIAAPLDPVLVNIILVTLGVLIFVGPIASVLISVFSNNWVIVLGTCLLSAAGFLIAAAHFQDPLALFAGAAIQVGGLLLAIGGVQSRRRWAAVWHAFEELSGSVHAPSIVPHEEPSSHFMRILRRESFKQQLRVELEVPRSLSPDLARLVSKLRFA
jgi:hypothetical protein